GTVRSLPPQAARARIGRRIVGRSAIPQSTVRLHLAPWRTSHPHPGRVGDVAPLRRLSDAGEARAAPPAAGTEVRARTGPGRPGRAAPGNLRPPVPPRAT